MGPEVEGGGVNGRVEGVWRGGTCVKDTRPQLRAGVGAHRNPPLRSDTLSTVSIKRMREVSNRTQPSSPETES